MHGLLSTDSHISPYMHVYVICFHALHMLFHAYVCKQSMEVMCREFPVMTKNIEHHSSSLSGGFPIAEPL